MASEYTSAGTSFKIFHEGEWHELIIRTRKAHPQVTAEELAQLTQKTIGLWLRVWRSVKQEVWQLAGDAPETVLAERIGTEPMVTVFNKKFDGLSITVNSSDSGQSALDCVMALIFAHDDILAKMPQLFSGANTTAPAKPAPAAPAQQAKRDINNVDDYIPPYAQKAVQRHNDIAQAPKTAQVKAFVRPAMKGSLPSTLKLQKGAKGKETWEMAIVPDKPYSSNAADFQEKDLLAYPIMGAIRYEGSSNGFYFVVPVPNSEIRIYQRESTNHNGQLIESDSQKLIKHLGVTGELIQGMKWEVPATHIALKVGKTGDKGQFKNYQGFYELN